MSPYPTRPRHRSSSDPLETVDKEDDEMGLGVSLFLIAVGAILTWAVNAEVSGLDITTVGVILLVVGVAGLLLSLLFWSSGRPRLPRRAPRAPHDVRRRRPSVLGRTTEYHYSPRAGRRRPSRYEEASGSSNVKMEPDPSSDSTQIRPSMRRISSRQM